MKDQRCPICNKTKSASSFVSGHMVRPAIVELIQKDLPQWTENDAICRSDLNHYRAILIQESLEAQKGEISTLDQEVLNKIKSQELEAYNINEDYIEHRTPGDRLADNIAKFGGSWKFIISFGVVLFLWILTNAYFLTHAFDPFPFILLNLILSCLAAIQAPVIMMSQNRQEAKDRLRAEQDYKINLKAELEIRALHEKFDHVLLKQWERLIDIQQMQIEIMDELTKDK
jgi:uncharacterized membrane protein